MIKTKQGLKTNQSHPFLPTFHMHVQRTTFFVLKKGCTQIGLSINESAVKKGTKRDYGCMPNAVIYPLLMEQCEN
jgi:hypothetical protein